MAFYSLVVWTPGEIQIREKGILLDPGTNAFNIETQDLDSLKACFDEAGARIVQCHKLDDFDAIEPDPEIVAALGSHTLPTLPGTT